MPAENIFIQKATEKDIEVVQQIAYATWPATYGKILSPEQLSYMLQLFYSTESLAQQMSAQGHNFIVAYENHAPIAFADYSYSQKEIYKLHKLYVMPQSHGKGAGKKLIEYIILAIKKAGATALQLNVNRMNAAKIFYEKLGFTVLYEEDIAIGNGYFMNDYIMEKKIESREI